MPLSEQLGFAWLESVHPQDRERVRDEWRAAVKAGKRFDAEFRVRSSAGGYRLFKARSVPIRDSSGVILKWYGANTDVDDVKRAVQSQRVLTPRSEASDREGSTV